MLELCVFIFTLGFWDISVEKDDDEEAVLDVFVAGVFVDVVSTAVKRLCWSWCVGCAWGWLWLWLFEVPLSLEFGGGSCMGINVYLFCCSLAFAGLSLGQAKEELDALLVVARFELSEDSVGSLLDDVIMGSEVFADGAAVVAFESCLDGVLAGLLL